MRQFRIIFGLTILSIVFSLSAFAVSAPQIFKPVANDASLRPLIQWNPVKNADSYSLKLKSVDSTTGVSTTIEEATITAPTNSYRPTTTLTANNYYLIILRAIDGAEQSDKTKLNFQAKDKFIVLGHTLFGHNGTGTFDTFTRYVFLVLSPNTFATGNIWVTGASFFLQQGAIITGFSITLIDDTASDSICFLSKSMFGGDLAIVGPGSLLDPASNIVTSGSDISARTFDLAYDLTDTTTLAEATIDNNNAHYQVDLDLAQDHDLDRVIIRYID